MLFADLYFLYAFLPICFAAYFLFKNINAKNAVLIITSLIFYAYGEPLKIFLFVGSALLNYLLARWIDSTRGKKICKAVLTICLLYNFGMLGVFKYTDFMISNVNAIFGSHIPAQNIALPLGISFYTFQIVSYVIDVYWEKVPVQKKFHKLLLYISLFPQLVAGPIVRYQTVAEEIDNRRTTIYDVIDGFTRLIIGLSKKVLLANNLNTIVNNCFGENISDATVVATWIGVIAYAMQVYFDFSGYSDMAIGIGRIFGFHFDENFRHPFMCRSISEFWQRWHISLGSFFRDYLLYVPIFGKRRAVLSLFLVWFTTGLWHGASWNYVIWGLYFGVFIFIETKIGKKRLKNAPTLLMHIYNKLVILIGFGIFKFENISELGNFFKNLVGANGNIFANTETFSNLKSHIFIFAIALVACFPIAEFFKRRFEASHPFVASLAMVCTTAFLILLLFINTAVLVKTFSSNNPFLYWNF
ncbi:MAG: MBOAT family protein [Ruminococcaceae bacterium]|nr:MBOAT family protein [Oscillospiraceae bacterium]